MDFWMDLDGIWMDMDWDMDMDGSKAMLLAM